VHAYQTALRRLARPGSLSRPDRQLVCFVSEKAGPRTADDGRVLKSGFHLMFPDVLVECTDLKHTIHHHALQHLVRLRAFAHLCGGDGEGPDRAKSFVDNCAGTNWLMYGSRKHTDTEAYRLTRIIGADDPETGAYGRERVNAADLESFLADYPVFSWRHPARRMALPAGRSAHFFLPRIMALKRPPTWAPPVLRLRQDAIEGTVAYPRLVRARVQAQVQNESEDDDDEPEDDRDPDPDPGQAPARAAELMFASSLTPAQALPVVRRLLGMLRATRADPYREWLEVAMCLHSVGHGAHEYFVEFTHFSRRATRPGGYSYAGCRSKWDELTRSADQGGGTGHQPRRLLGMGTLRLMARTDSPAEYRAAQAAMENSAIEKACERGGHECLGEIMFGEYR
jgi:hypothetical protein